MKKPLAAFAAATMRSQSATVEAIGFSRKTCLPASSAATAGSACWSHIVVILTDSISGSASEVRDAFRERTP